MIRRRRPRREVAFSFDSFLDVVANVVGIILRLILVAWVGAQSYTAAMIDELAPPAPAPLAEAAPLPEPTDPLATVNQRRRTDLDKAKGLLAQQMVPVEPLRQQRLRIAEELDDLAARRKALADERKSVEHLAKDRGAVGQALVLSLSELSGRSKQLLKELDELQKAPSRKKSLRYRMPVSQPVTEEVSFECQGGRVTLIDVEALADKVHQAVRSRQEQLRLNGRVKDVTPAVGAFRLRYLLERERGGVEANIGLSTSGGPSDVTVEWEAEPVLAERGETADAALAAGSAFRKVIESIEPRQTAVTLWVYDDSFALYRRLRDYLHDRDVAVAARPLSNGMPIAASSRRGTKSRGQ